MFLKLEEIIYYFLNTKSSALAELFVFYETVLLITTVPFFVDTRKRICSVKGGGAPHLHLTKHFVG